MACTRLMNEKAPAETVIKEIIIIIIIIIVIGRMEQSVDRNSLTEHSRT